MKKIILLAISALAIISCSEEDTFTPGPEAKNNGQSVFFAGDYETITLFDERPVNDSVEIAVVRTNPTLPLDVPIIFEGDTAIKASPSVHFDAMQDTAYYVLKCPNIEITKRADFKLRISDEYADIYGKKDGITSISSSVLWSEWKTLADTVLIISSYDKHPRQGCKLEYFVGDNRFRFTDFLGSGNPLVFKLGSDIDTKNIRNNSGSMIPYSNYYAETTQVWDWSNDGEWTPWTPVGGTIEIYYPSFGYGHVYYESYGGYDNIDFRVTTPDTLTLKGSKYVYDKNYYDNNIQMVYMHSTDNSSSYWEYLYFIIGYKVE